MIRCAVLLVSAACGCAPAVAHAQYVNRDVPRAGTIEVSGAATWTSGRNAGSVAATETSNPAVSPNPLTLFRADSRVKPSTGVEGQVGVYL